MVVKSAPPMLEWQYRTILGQIDQVYLHASDDSCPCNQVALEPGEFCLAKHLLSVSTLGSETSLMDPDNRDMLTELSSEALEHHNTAKGVYCRGGEWPDLEQWARDWRKKLEPIYYTCAAGKKKVVGLKDIGLDEVLASLSQVSPLTKQIEGLKTIADELTMACPEHYDDRSYTGIIRDLRRRTDALKQVEVVVAAVVAPPAKAAPVVAPAVGPAITASNKTFAVGATGVTRYDFEFKIVDAQSLLVSHDPFTFVANPRYPQELQPRLRERVATRLQVQNIAANLNPEALLVDYKSIDRGAPIIFSDKVVESGNGRVMALVLAAKDYPDRFAKYRKALKEIAPSYGLSTAAIEKLKVPVLVRERLTKVARKDFVQEANASTTIEQSAIEKARTDAEKITPAMLNALDVLEGEAIEDALRAARNKQFIVAFLSKLPENEQARLVDAKGVLNQDGVRRAAMAIFVATFKGETGLKLAEKFFESIDPDVRMVFNGLVRSLGPLAQAETLVAKGERVAEYSFGNDLAKAVSVYSAIKKTPSLTVPKYLAQQQLYERDLTPFQERILSMLDEKPRSAKRIASVLTAYANLVIASAPPSQAGFMPEVRATREELFEQAVKQAQLSEITLEDVLGYEWLANKLKCDLSKDELETALSWRPLRDFIAWAVGTGKKVELCTVHMVAGRYQLTIHDVDEGQLMSVATKKANLVPNLNRVRTPYRELVYEVVVPASPGQELTWNPQEVTQPEGERGEQVAMFGIPLSEILEEVTMEDKTRANLKAEEPHPYAVSQPKSIDIWGTTIERHYVASEAVQEGSIRVLKPHKDILVTIGCRKGDKWDGKTCSPRPTILSTIVPKTKHYEDELAHQLEIHPELKPRVHRHGKEKGVEARADEPTKGQTVVGEQASVSIPLTCGDGKVSKQTAEAIEKAEVINDKTKSTS